MALSEAIKIAVRVRPFDDKEIAARQQICVEMVSMDNMFVIEERANESRRELNGVYSTA